MVFENVGAKTFEACYKCLGVGGRIAVCGAIAEYNKTATEGVRIDPMQMIYTAQRIEGFVCTPWLTGQRGPWLQDMATWVKDGLINTEETFFEGIDAWPTAFASLFTGAHKGKVVVRV
jgi:NADPH-dependent curcumin reductase CurA